MTISFHLGGQNDIRHEHNVRNPKVVSKESHIDMNKENGYAIWLDEDIKKVYDELFGNAIQEYNEKKISSGHKEQVIDDYLCKCKKSKQLHYGRELLIQVGNYKERPDDKTCRKILKRFCDEFIKRNRSNVRVFGVYLHNDEKGGIHLHIDIVFFARDCNRGPTVQNSMTKALEQLGYRSTSSRDTAQIAWEHSESAELEKICRDYGLEIEHPELEHKKHMKIKEYRLMKQLEELEYENKSLMDKKLDLEDRINALIEHHDSIIDDISELEGMAIEKAEELLDEYQNRSYDDRSR